MKRIILHILCEGPTEQRFAKEVLAPYLNQFNIFAKPTILVTSKKKNARGGMLKYSQAEKELGILFKQFRDNEHELHVFTSMFDYYALPSDFPGFDKANQIHDVRSRISYLEKEFADKIKKQSFIPYIQLHEFESLLFVDIEKLKLNYPQSAKKIDDLKEQVDRIKDPELINNSPTTAPSKRIIKAVEDKYRYNKVQSGTNITSLIGIERLLDNCQHFSEWIERIKTKSEEILNKLS